MNHKVHLAQSAEAMLLAREHNFPITIADMYDRDTPAESLRDLPGATLRDRNDEVLERIYSGTPSESLRERRLKNDTVGEAFPERKRLEKLFDLYTKMTAK